MSNNQPLTIPLLNERVIQAMSDDVGADICQQLSLLFIEELKQLLQKISLATEQQQLPDIIDAVHILKNSAALYGASKLAFLATAIHDDTLQTPPQLLHRTGELVDIAQQTLLLYKAYFKNKNTKKGFYD